MSEHILRIDPAGVPRATILIIPPLFEEANRTRRTLVLAMRALAADGFAAVLATLRKRHTQKRQWPRLIARPGVLRMYRIAPEALWSPEW